MATAEYQDSVIKGASLESTQDLTATVVRTRAGSMTAPYSTSVDSTDESKPSAKKGVSNFGAICNILVTAVGVGMLGLPNAVASVGYILGFVMFVVCVGIAVVCCKLLQQAMWHAIDIGAKMDPPVHVTKYEDIGQMAFGRPGKVAVALALHSALVGCSCIIALLMGKAASRMWPSVSQTNWIIISCAVMLPFVWLRTMKHIGFVASTFGTASIVALTLTVVVAGFSYVSVEGPYDWLQGSPARKYTAKVSSLWGLGTAFGTLTFAFAVTCTLPTILNDMEHKKDAGKVIVAGVTATSVVYGAVAVCGYMGFGSLLMAKGVEDILSVLEPNTPLATAMDVIVLLVCITHYAVMINPSCRALESQFTFSKDSLVYGSLIRTGLVVFTALIAIYCGKFSALVDLIGSISFACVHMVFPPLFLWRLRMRVGLSNWSTRREKILTVSYAVLVFLAAIGGTIGAVSSIMKFTSS
jgi:amino acid permease